jgi:hypothetical protein
VLVHSATLLIGELTLHVQREKILVFLATHGCSRRP